MACTTSGGTRLTALKCCSVFLAHDILYIECSHQTQSTFWVAGLPRCVVEKAASPACIGTFVLAVMRESQLLVPTPEDLKKVGTESMHFKNFKTNKQLEAEARLCSVILYDDEEGAVRVEIEPYERASKRRSSQRGYVPIPNTILSVPPDAEVVGRGILKAFDINAEG